MRVTKYSLTMTPTAAMSFLLLLLITNDISSTDLTAIAHIHSYLITMSRLRLHVDWYYT